MNKVEFVVTILKDLFNLKQHELWTDDMVVISIYSSEPNEKHINSAGFGIGLTEDSILEFMTENEDITYAATVANIYKAMVELVEYRPEHHMMIIPDANWDGHAFMLTLIPISKPVCMIKAVNLSERMDGVV